MHTIDLNGENNMTDKALVLFSGGLDSAVSLYWAKARGWEISTIEMEYYQRPARERQACAALRKHAGIGSAGSISVPIDFIREASDLPGNVSANASLHQAPQGYIPARNMVFYAICGYYAEILGSRYIVGGHNQADSRSFPDAGIDFFDGLNQLIRSGLWSYPHIHTEILLPFIGVGKAEVLRQGHSLDVPFELTWSCYYDAELPCRECKSCAERKDAFAAAGLKDPLSIDD
jgi:7-cyano-7-deazaguanine synthase